MKIVFKMSDRNQAMKKIGCKKCIESGGKMLIMMVFIYISIFATYTHGYCYRRLQTCYYCGIPTCSQIDVHTGMTSSECADKIGRIDYNTRIYSAQYSPTSQTCRASYCDGITYDASAVETPVYREVCRSECTNYRLLKHTGHIAQNDEDATHEDEDMSLADCIEWCADMTGCFIFNYEQSETTCYLHTDCGTTCSISAQSGHDTYVRQCYCRTLSNYTGATLTELTGVEIGDTATYSCNLGYELTKEAVRTCQDVGSWSVNGNPCSRVDCGSPPGPDNGGTSWGSYGTRYGDTKTYYCHTGYTLSGNTTTQCQADKTWSGTVPTCTIVDCLSPTAPTNGAIDASGGTTYNSVATITCNSGYVLSGSSTTRCRSSGTWSGSSTCYLVDCGNLGNPPNGVVDTSSGTTYTSTATYSCTSGYEMTGSATRTCQADQTWSNTAPVCAAVDCGIPPNPTNGNVNTAAGTTYTSVASYSCDTGYTLTGDVTRTCLATKAWSTSAPTCVIVDCLSPTAPTNGDVTATSGTTYTSVATITCDTGYELSGSSTTTCQADGSWSAGTACNAVDCGVLSNPPHGVVDTSSGTTYTSTATYSCTSGYEMTGSVTRTCQADQTWSNSAPVCAAVDCGTLPNPINGDVDTSAGTTYTSVATYSCDTGYTLTGDVSRTCLATKAWSTSAPTCVIVDCLSPTAPTNGDVTATSGTTYTSAATITCDTGYELSGSSTTTCQADGSWSTDTACNAVDCGVLSNPTHGVVDTSSGTTYTSTAIYSCTSGYEMTGSATRTCQADQMWSTSAPVCTIVDCSGLPNPTNGDVDTSAGTTYTSVATYSCDTGYTLTGDVTRTCLATKAWSSSAPTCVVVDCLSPTAPTNGDVTATSGTTYTSAATITCDTGYELSGSSTTTCQADGSWSTGTACNAVDCGVLSNPTHGVVDTSSGTTYISTATYSCTSGYEMTGSATRTCQADQTWSTSAPVCTIVDCGSLPNPANGDVDTSAGTTYTSVATYSCDTGYTLTGDVSRTCLATKAWSTSAPTCVIVDCFTPDPPINGSVDSTSGTTYNSVAYYSCDPGFDISGSHATTCQSDGFWGGAIPNCTAVDCGPPSVPINGNVSTSSGTRYPSVATYTCISGYQMTGSDVTACQADQTWNSTTPTCSPVECGNLTDPLNGNVNTSTGTTYSSVASYSCAVGYAISGDVNRTCLATALWSSTEPTCPITDCGSVIAPVNGNASATGTTYGHTATYVCDVGHVLTGNSTRTCQDSELWSGPTPTCNPIDCGALIDPIYGTVDVSGGTQYLSAAAYTCDGNHTMVGTQTRYCQASGVWNGSMPFCYQPAAATPAPSTTALYIRPCFCVVNSSFEGLSQDEIIEMLVRDTAIDITNTSLARRKLMCMSDPRASSQAIGVAGIGFLSFIFGAMFLLDLVSIRQHCQSRSYQYERSPDIMDEEPTNNAPIHHFFF